MKQQHLFLIVGSLPLLLSGCHDSTPVDEVALGDAHVLEVNVVPVTEGPIESSIELTGTLYPWKFATIASEVSGVIESVVDSDERLDYEVDGKAYSKVLPLDIGHAVSEGDILLRINSSEQEHALRLAKAKKTLAEKELANLFAWKRTEEITQLEAQCEECDAILLDAEANLRRFQSLETRNAASTKDVEDAQRSVSTAKAAKKRSEAALELSQAGPTTEQVEVAKAQLELAEADVALKQDMVDKCTIRCPMEKAWIVERYVGVGDHVTANPSTSLMRLVDSSILLAQVHVPERYQGLIEVQDRATLSALGGRAAELHVGEVEAMVVLVNAQIDPDTRTFRIRVGIDNSRDLFKAGTFVKVRIPLRTVPDAIVVPAAAISFAQGEPAAFVVHGGIIDRVPVTLGVSNRTHYQIVDGLSSSDMVVQGDLSLLAPGLPVKAQTVTAEAQSTTDTSSSVTPTQG